MWANTGVQGLNSSLESENTELLTCQFQVTNLPVIKSEIEDINSVVCASTHLYLIAVVDKKISIFKEESSELFWEIETKEKVCCISPSDDSCLLLVGEFSGEIHLFHISSKTLLWSYIYQNEESSAIKEALIVTDSSEMLRLLIFTNHGESFYVYEFSNISLPTLYNAVENQNLHNVFDDVHLKKLNLSEMLPNCEIKNIFRISSYCPMVGLGISSNAAALDSVDAFCADDMIYGFPEADWEYDADEKRIIQCFDFSAYDNAIKAACTKDGRYVVFLNEKYTLNVMCSFTSTILKTWIDENKSSIINFVLNETVDPSSSLISDRKIGLLFAPTSEDSGYFFEIRNFPSFNLIFNMNLSNFAKIADCNLNQEFWCILDGGLNIDDSGHTIINHLNVKKIFEASAEARLMKLISRRKFVEAKKLAEISSINSEIIYRTKVSCILNKLSMMKDRNLSQAETDNLWNEFNESLKHITDMNFVNSVLVWPVPDEFSMKKVLLCVRNWVMSHSDNKGSQKDLQKIISKVNLILCKLTTHEIIYTIAPSCLILEDFLKVDLVNYMISELQNGDLQVACLIWQRHKDDLLLSLNEESIEKLITAIPDSLSSYHLIPFLCEDFLPFLLSKIPSCIDLVADWLRHRVYLIEFYEKDVWPENGMALVAGFLNVIKNLHEKEKMGEMSFSANLSISSIHKKIATASNPVGCLAEFSKALTWLIKLKSQFNCRVALSEFWNAKVDVMFAALDHVSVSQIAKIVDDFVRPYAIEHELELDLCLEQYIDKTFQSYCFTWWFWNEESWEERLIAVTENIHSTNCWEKAALMIVNRASVPWSERVKKLVQKGIECDCKRSKEFQIQAKLVGLKEVLLKYDMQDFPINNDRNLINALVNYIFKQNRAEVLEDVQKVLMSVSDQSHSSDIYYKYLQFALNQNKMDQVMEVFSSLPENLATPCAKRLLKYIKLYLDNRFFIEEQKELTTNMLYTSLHLVEFLKKNKESFIEEEIQTSLKSLLTLREKFDIFMTFSEVSCYLKRQEVLEAAIKDFLTSRRNLIKDIDSSVRKPSLTSGIFSLYRLGDILLFEREEVIAFLITNCLQEQEYDLVLKLCKELTESFPSSNITQVLMQVVDHFYQNFRSITDINFGAMINTIHHLNSVAITYCNEDSLEKFMNTVHLSIFLSSIKNISGQYSLPIAPEYTIDSYHKWRFYPFYCEEGFQLDCENVTDFVMMVCGAFVKHPNDTLVQIGFSENDVLLNMTKQLVQHMLDRGHEVAALRTLFYYFHMKSKMLAAASDITEVYSSIFQDFLSVTHTILQRVLSERRVDSNFAYSLLSGLPENSQHLSLKWLVKWCSSNLNRLATVARIGVEVAKSSQKNDALSMYENIYKKASLLSRCNVKSVPMEIILTSSSQESSWPVVREMIHTQDIDLRTLYQCCSAFQLPNDNVLITYLNHILLESEKKFLNNESTDVKVKQSLEQAAGVMNCIKDEELLYNHLKKLMISPYSYEFLHFTEKILHTLSANLQTISTSSFEKNSKLLKFFKVYQRTSQVTDIEINRWSALYPSNPELPEIASKRLPFHIFLEDNPFSIINPELSANTVDVWLKIAPVLKIPDHNLIIIAVKNTVLKYLKQHSSPHIILYHDADFVDMIYQMISKVKEPESSVACASWVANQMPSGGNKFEFASMAVDYAQKWYEQSTASVINVYKKLSSLKEQYAVENILHKNNLVSEKILSLKKSPSQLIEHLIEEFSLDIDQCVKACKAIVEINDVIHPNIDLIREILKFIFKWLNVPKNDTPSSNLDESFLPLSPVNKEWEDDDTNGRNLYRIINLLLCLPQSLFENLFGVLQDNFKMMSSIQRPRLLFCFVSVFDMPTVAQALEWDPRVLEDQFILLQCSVEIENLKLPYSLQTFNKCNKTELVQRILSINFHNRKAVVFCIQLCMEYDIWNEDIWEVILRRMTVKDGKDYPLQGILLSVQGNLTHLWHNSAFKNAWKCVFSRILGSMDDSTIFASELYRAVLSCPCISSLDDFFTMDELNCITQTFEEKGLAEIMTITDTSSLILNLMKAMGIQSQQDDH